MKPTSILMLLLCCFLHGNAQENSDTSATCNACHCCVHTQAPAGIVTGHMHTKGSWMLSYSYSATMLQGNRAGTTPLSSSDVYSKYEMAPETMNMQMHMAMLMYGVTDRLTLMAMGGLTTSYMTMSMTAMSMPGMSMQGMTMETQSVGAMDSRIYALYNFSGAGDCRITGSAGLQLPTGSVRATGTTALGEGQRLTYCMQPGTGSVSILPGITVIKEFGSFAAGIDAGGEIRLNDNSPGYRFGDVYHSSAWVSYTLQAPITLSLRAEGIKTATIKGTDAATDVPAFLLTDPTANAANYGGSWVNAYAGVHVRFIKPALSKFSLLAEVGLPVYQNLNGLQMAARGSLIASVQYAF